ncbi:hypothetical protein WAI453_002942 [Rhynchosporium graminicola]
MKFFTSRDVFATLPEVPEVVPSPSLISRWLTLTLLSIQYSLVAGTLEQFRAKWENLQTLRQKIHHLAQSIFSKEGHAQDAPTFGNNSYAAIRREIRHS